MRRILVADDQPDARLLVRLVLEREAFEVVEAADGEEALAAIEEGSFDLVLLDVRLPTIDGLDVLRSIRARAAVPVLMVSAATGTEMAERARQAGADGFLAKPYRPADLIGAVRLVLEGAGQHGEAPGADIPA